MEELEDIFGEIDYDGPVWPAFAPEEQVLPLPQAMPLPHAMPHALPHAMPHALPFEAPRAEAHPTTFERNPFEALQLSEQQKRALTSFMTSKNNGNAAMRQVVGALVGQIGPLSGMLSESHEDNSLKQSKFEEAVRVVMGLREGVSDMRRYVVGEKTQAEAMASLGATLERYRDVRKFHPDLVSLEQELSARPTKRAHIETQTEPVVLATAAATAAATATATEPVMLSSRIKYNLIVRLADGTTYTY